MAIQIFEDLSAPGTGERSYYVTGVAGAPCMLWTQQQDRWACEPGTLPGEVTALPLAELPTALQEELLALAARAEVLGPQGWNVNEG